MVGQSARLNRRERAWVTVAGVIPDADGLGLLAEIATRGSSHPLNWWSDYHHVLGHNLTFAAIFTLLAACFAERRLVCSALVFLSFHLHLLGDIVGARGPDGYQWPIPYLAPFNRELLLTWSGQWPLNGWPNLVLTAILIGLTIHLARLRGYSPLEMISRNVDETFINTLRRRFPLKPGNS